MKTIFTLFVFFVLSGCTCKTNLTLQIENPENYAQSATISVTDEKGFQKRKIESGSIDPKQNYTNELTLKDISTVEITARKPNQMGNVFISSKTYDCNSSKNEFFKVMLSNTSASNGNNLDDPNRFEIIKRNFSYIGRNIGADPIGIQDAINSVFGGLIITQVNRSNGTEEIKQRLSPSQIGNTPITYEQIRFPSTRISDSQKVSSSLALKAAIEFPAIAAFKALFNDNSAYELTWSLNGFGIFYFPERTTRITNYNNLPNDAKDIIKYWKNYMSDDIRIYYIDKIYIVKSANMRVAEAVKLDSEVNAGVYFVSGDGKFSFERTNSKDYSYDDVVLNFEGSQLIIPNLTTGEPQDKTIILPAQSAI